MKILVLGGNGFIGSHLVDALVRNVSNQVTVYDLNQELFRKPLENVNYIYGSINDNNLLADSLENIDIVYHLVSTMVPSTSNANPVKDINDNLISTVKLLEICSKKGVKKITYLSSGGAIYGNPKVIPIPEDHPYNPESSYGIVKLAVEKYIKLFHSKYGLDYSIIRAANPYGTRQNPKGIQGVIPIFLYKAICDKEIDIWGNGDIIRDYIYVKDLVSAIIKASELDSEQKTFNIGSGIGYSLNDILLIISKILNKKLKVNYIEKKIFDPNEIVLDISKARNHLNWATITDMEDGIKSVIDFIKSEYKV